MHAVGVAVKTQMLSQTASGNVNRYNPQGRDLAKSNKITCAYFLTQEPHL